MTFVTDWKRVRDEDPAFRCAYCGEGDVKYREWESDDGGHEDFLYSCDACNHTWWVEGADA
jgi:predicted SprT family Zn-dependent metalloprotease